jgi:hypothetical protein
MPEVEQNYTMDIFEPQAFYPYIENEFDGPCFDLNN